MTSIKRWRRIVFDAELDCSGSCLAGNLGSNSEPKMPEVTPPAVITLPFSNDPGLLVGRPDKRQ
jgi:hypothetical protein